MAKSSDTSTYPFGAGTDEDVKAKLKATAEARMEEIVSRVRVRDAA